MSTYELGLQLMIITNDFMNELMNIFSLCLSPSH